MRKHNGMRPQDVVILLKIISLADKPWQLKDLAHELSISASEVSESLNRSYLAGLIDYDKRKVRRQSLMEFLQYGLHYVFPQHPGAVVNGIPTAHSHPFMRNHFESNEVYVWPDTLGKNRGHSIEPFYQKQINAVKIDEALYLLLALVDVIRVGRIREVNVAVDKLKEIILS
ncbi:helix-turn-helix domain-containing protein [Pinibacter aurantiacus]|uniref:Uncharacterized protein n=1 Tax=Pinibacter aurantiacus TaxID=2851599 RepID=A0A9E2S866_9BACT|nr:hypothetical protein [Pinibacter aurantiacus]MBV4356289.1 hypothetical protein [Pinibacter aurantiacus]